MSVRPLSANGFKLSALLLWRTAWIATALAAAVLFFCFGLLFRVFMGPVSLGPFRDDLREALGHGLRGLNVRFDDAVLEWSRNEGRISLVILGTRVFDQNQRIIAQAPKAEIGLAVGPFLSGRIVVSRITLVGVQLTLVHTKTGSLRLGVQSGPAGYDVLQRIRDAISHRSGGSSQLETFAIRDARIAFLDETTGTFLIAPEADLQVAMGNSAAARQRGTINASLSARIEISGKPARVYASVDIPPRADLVSGDISVTGLDLAALAADGKTFAFLAPFSMTADITGSWTLVNATRLKFADFSIGASGKITGLGPPLQVRSLRLIGRYDGSTDRLLIDDASLACEQANAHLTGSANLTFNGLGEFSESAFAFSLDRISVEVPGAMEHVITLGRALFKGVYRAADRSILLRQGYLSGGPLSALIAGRISFLPNKSPGLDLDGRVGAISVRDLLSYWPLHVAPGARAWIAGNVTSGHLGPALVRTRIAAGALEQANLPDSAISASFPITEATISYLHGLTPVTKVAGTAILGGDTFKASVASASVGPLSLTNGRVTIANLHLPGTPVNIDAHVAGQLPEILSLLDMKPLQYPTRFHINTSETRGAASFDLSFQVPTIRGVSIDRIGISVKGTVRALALSLGPHTRISNGTLAVSVDNNRLHANGRIDVGSVSLAADWLETFKTSNPITTQIAIEGVLDDAQRAAVNLPLGKMLTGPVGVQASLEGHRGSIQDAKLHLDLSPAAFSIDPLAWTKPQGTPASAEVWAQLDDGGNLRSADIALDGRGIAARGIATFAPDGGLQSLELPTVRLGQINDFALDMRDHGVGGLDLAITGRSLDGSWLGRQNGEAGSSDTARSSARPFHINVNVERFALRNGVALMPFALDASGLGWRPRTLQATGNLTKTAPLIASIAEGDKQRSITVTAGDAGALIRGLLGYSSVKGGELSVHATMPPLTAESHKNPNVAEIAGEITIRNSTLLNQPFLTRLFSSGSPGGFVDLVGGQGISLSHVEIPFRVIGSIINIHDARASGPSIGITADGYIDRHANQVALQGAVAPLYGINGLLGAIPVLGSVFVSKKGEGIFGMTYNVRGDVDEPKITTNPLSVLAPGILRRAFEGSIPSAPASPAGSLPPQHFP